MEFDDPGAHGLAHPPPDSTVGCGVRGVFSLSPRLIDEGAKAPVDPPQTPTTCGVERVREVRTLRTECGTESNLDGSPCHMTGTDVPVGQPTNVYLMYDGAGALLYVGISNAFGYRAKQHSKEKEWWPSVARVELEHYPDRPAAEARELELIRERCPRHNIAHNLRPAWTPCPDCGESIGWQFAALPGGFFERDGWIYNGWWWCDSCEAEVEDCDEDLPEYARVCRVYDHWNAEVLLSWVFQLGISARRKTDKKTKP